jgi:MoaA/NifB/PqqE/SkfB family radical SAM enzyme
MGLMNNHWELLRYKLRHVGLHNTLRVAYLDFSETLLFHLAKRWPSFQVSPRSIQIECTTRCNLKCAMCEISYWTEKGGDLELANLQSMLEHLPKLKRVDLTGIGEALMNRGFFNALRILKSRGLYVTLNDNFTLMTEDAARRIVELGIDQIFLSLDGATKETYEKIRVGANFDKVVSNARRLIQIKQDTRKKRPEVKINTVVCSTNYRELPALIELASNMGIGMVQFVNVMVFENTVNLDTTGVQQKVKAQFEESLERARQLGVLVKIELFDKQPVQRCDFPWKRNFVTYDGYIHPCCYTTQTGDRKAQNQRSFGNLIARGFEEIWNGEPYSAFRKKMGLGILPYECQRCPKYTGTQDAAPRVSGERLAVAVGRATELLPRVVPDYLSRAKSAKGAKLNQKTH